MTKTIGCLARKKYWDTFRGSLKPNKRPQKNTYVEHLDKLIQSIDDGIEAELKWLPKTGDK